jgi:hypothetical protein
MKNIAKIFLMFTCKGYILFPRMFEVFKKRMLDLVAMGDTESIEIDKDFTQKLQIFVDQVDLLYRIGMSGIPYWGVDI